MGTYRGLNISGGLRANFKKLRVKKTIDEMEISDRGAITGTPSDLTTKGAGHRRGRNNNQRRGARGATRESVDYGFITGADSNIVQEHDYGTVIETTTSLTSAAFETRRSLGLAASIADEETAVAPTAALPGSVSLYNSTGIIPAGTPLILNGDGTVSAVTGGSYQGAGLSTTYDNPNSTGDLGRSASISDTYVAATDAVSGTVSIFNRETGTHIRTHTKSADSSERWGWYVDNSDDYVVVGDASPDYARQVLDVWRLSDGASMTTIYYPTIGNNMFPGSVAINGNKILAGAYQTPSQNPGTGAYLWNAQNGSLLRSYSREIADAGHFGRAVTMNSTYAFVFSPFTYPQSLGYAEYPAKVHMFTFTSNNAVQRYPISWFGGSSQAVMDCDETHVIIGGGGKAGIIDIATGNLVHEFVPPDGEASHVFGGDVSIDGNYAAVRGNGKVFVYEVPTGNLLATLEDPDGNALTFYSKVIRARSNGDILVANRIAADGGKLYKYTIGEIQTTNLTEDNYIGFAGSEFSYDGSLGQVITAPGIVTGLSGLVNGADYYVQNDGTISTIETSVFVGTATSTTTLELSLAGEPYGDLGVVLGAYPGGHVQWFNINNPGSATSVGSFSQEQFSMVSNATYGVTGGGYSNTTAMYYITFASLGNAEVFGTLNTGKRYSGAASDGSTGLFAGGGVNTSEIDSITISTQGSSSSFGNLRIGTSQMIGGATNKVIAIFGPGEVNHGKLQYINFSTGGQTVDFGVDSAGPEYMSTSQRAGTALCSDLTRGLLAGGPLYGATDAITYVTIATPGNTSTFGNLTQARSRMAATTNDTYAVFCGGYKSDGDPAYLFNIMDYVTIQTTGQASDFGDLTQATDHLGASSGNGA